MDRFQELLWDLGEIVNVPFHVDKNHACHILLDDKLAVHMEITEEGEQLLIGALLGEIPPGRFREHVLKESLKVNALPNPFGSFAYIDKTNTLVLQTFLALDTLNGQKLAQFLEDFIREAESWREAIGQGHFAPHTYLSAHNKHPPLYSIPPKTT